MTNLNIKADVEQLPSKKYCATFHFNASFVKSKSADRQEIFNSDVSTPTEEALINTTNDILNDLIRSAFEEVTLANNLTPAAAPTIELISKDVQIEYVFTTTFDVVPSIELNGLSSVNVEIPEVIVTTEDLESTIDAIFKQHPNRETALAALGIKESEFEKFRSEVLLNLQREAITYESEIKKNAVLTRVCDIFNIIIPDCMISPELERLQTIQDESGVVPLPLPKQTQVATRNVQRRIVINAVIQKSHLSLHPNTVRQRVEQLSTAYENPEEAVQWYYSNRVELAGVEAKIVEELVIEWLINACNQSTYTMSFTQASAALTQH
ncbi:hypothetical protein MNBD_GAMMA05-599 [hydrothermal vent metagenome]|uniref:Trigger factor n=1 Tax=hydrothermal vent metagenome TaxID=652676 RepID=A0A3B0W806_9ZZZZ